LPGNCIEHRKGSKMKKDFIMGEDRFDPGQFKNLLNTLPGTKTAEVLQAF
jgi:hypothetical protein